VEIPTKEEEEEEWLRQNQSRKWNTTKKLHQLNDLYSRIYKSLISCSCSGVCVFWQLCMCVL
jgi:hypothetical protein